MASLETRTSSTGAVSYRVVWREANVKQGETFATAKAAVDFRKLVEGHGNRWPNGWTRGQGFAEVTPAPSLPTFAEWAERAISSRALANDRTRADYLRDVRLHLNPVFGPMRLDQITREDVGRWLIEVRRTRSEKTVKNVHGLASSIMSDAIADDRFELRSNPFKGAAATIAAVRTEEMVFLSRSELDGIMAGMGHYQSMTLFLALTGLRWSEATALTVGDVQILGRRTVTVNKAWKRQPDNTFLLGPPKSRRSRRTISLSSEAVEAVIPLVSGRASAERLFTSVRGHTVHHGNFRYQYWLPAITRAQLEHGLESTPRIHDLRHTHASWLIAEGVDLVSIQRRLGHESIQTTIDRYGHLRSESDDQINAALDRVTERSALTAERACDSPPLGVAVTATSPHHY
jgi:integrase